MRRGSMVAAVAALLVAKAAPCPGAVRAAGERIVTFAAEVTVREDATLEVREEFLVRSEGSYFKWGLIRELPIDSEARWDKRFAGEWRKDTGIRVKIRELSEDGARVRYEQGSDRGYAQLRIGPAGAPLAPGDHRFVIRYAVEGALRLLADHDELYWNALGHYWQLPVDEATLRVRLPAGVPPETIRADAYAGGRGVSNPTERMREESPGAVSHRATNLGPAQSLSVVVRWPKGFVTPPRMGAFARDRWWLAAPAVLVLYYLIVWLSLGREPARGSVVARYEPPEGLSPAAVRYVRTTGSDGRTLAAVIAQLAGRGCLEVATQNGNYSLTPLKAEASAEQTLAPEEACVLSMLFEAGPPILIEPSKGRELDKYLVAIQGQLQKRLDGVYFARHLAYVALGILASLAAAMTMALTAPGRDTSGAVFLTGWFFFCATVFGSIVLINVVPAVERAVRGLGGARWLLLTVGVLVVFGGVFVVLLKMLATNISPTFSLVLAALVVINLASAPALKRLTPPGRQALDQIEGFRAFLEEVERDRMQRLNAPGAAPKAATEFLPYAIALEVREAWGDHLAEAFFATTTQR